MIALRLNDLRQHSDILRLRGGGGSLTIEPVEVSHLFERVAARHERSFQTAGVILCRTVEPGAEMVAGDRDRLEQAVAAGELSTPGVDASVLRMAQVKGPNPHCGR